MAEFVSRVFPDVLSGARDQRAYGQRRGYRMEWFTYGQVMEMALRFCRELDSRKIGKGDRVMLWGENCAEWIAVFLWMRFARCDCCPDGSCGVGGLCSAGCTAG